MKDINNHIQLLVSSGVQRSYKELLPKRFDSQNIIEVQSEARRIANHLNLDKLDFLVTYTTIAGTAAGKIETSRSKESFIEIDGKFADDPAVISSILAHELMHKFLFSHGIKLPVELDNERLTDIATMFYGLGKIRLLGNTYTKVTKKYEGNVTRTTTNTTRLGYLTEEEFTYAYVVVSCLFDVKENALTAGLLGRHLEQVRTVRTKHGEELDIASGKVRGKGVSSVRALSSLQRDLANVDKKKRLISEYVVGAVEAELAAVHQLISRMQRMNASRTSVSGEQELVDRISGVLAHQEYAENEDRINAALNRIEQVLSPLKAKSLNGNFSELHDGGTEAAIRKFNCPGCSRSMKISKNVVAKITCKNCHYAFLVDTTVVDEADGALASLQKKLGKFFTKQ